MKSSFGKTLRTVRKGKQVSITSLADEHLSKSQISRFERGESEISCIRLINLLDKLNISMDEFLALHENKSTKYSFPQLMQYIQEMYQLQKLDSLKKLLSKNSKFNISNLEKTMVKSILHTLDKSIAPTTDELLELTDYLFKIENWGYYEITLFGNCVRTINYPTFFLLTKEMLKNSIYSSMNKTNKKLMTQLSINCLISSIDCNYYNDAQYLIKRITNLLENELNYYEKNVFLYAKGYFEFKQSIPSGKLKMQNAIQVFKLLDEKNMEFQYKKHYNNVIKEH